MKRRRNRRLRVRRNPLPLLAALPAVAQVAVVGAGAVVAAKVAQNAGLHLGQNRTPGQPPGIFLNPHNPLGGVFPGQGGGVANVPPSTTPPADWRQNRTGPA